MRSLSILIIFIAFAGQAQQAASIIFDTDIAPDYDDVGALALLHAFADQGDAKILATISCNAFETTAPTLSLINTYFNRPEIPIGIVKAKIPYQACKQHWADSLVKKYPHTLKSNEEAADAVILYRKILSSQPDHSVTIITVGFFTNLANLLVSKGDEYSKLTGKELVRKKVKQLVSMAAGTGNNGSKREFNVWVDANAARTVLAKWPSPILISGFEIGERIMTGMRLIGNENIITSPVKDAFQIALTHDKNTVGRNSWDQSAVLVAVKGHAPWFDIRKINFEIKEDGTSVEIPGENFSYLVQKRQPSEVAKDIEDLMMHQPRKK